MNSTDLYEVTDFNLACVLKYCSCELADSMRIKNKKVWYFRRSKRMDDVLKQYWKGELVVNVVNFLASQDFMKSSIYAS